MASEGFLTMDEAARALGVTTRHARRLANDGSLSLVARGLVDRDAVDRYLASQQGGLTRVWAEHTAWAAIGAMSGRDVAWLGATQASRLRATLRRITEVDDLVRRLRGRARVHVYSAHRSVLPALLDRIESSDSRLIGITSGVGASVDGYLAGDQLGELVGSFGLRPDAGGSVVLRATSFDFDRVRELVATPFLAALDAATSVDPRLEGVGRRALSEFVDEYR